MTQDASRWRPAYEQTSVPQDKLLSSATAGFLIHRVGQLRYEFRDEGLHFSSDLVELINTAQIGHVSIFTFEELFGGYNRLHWWLHLKQPNDYARLLEMVDHNERWRQVSQMDRLPTKGGGNWERMFVEGSMSETIVCPQHGLSAHGDEAHPDDTFQPPAMFQTTVPADELLHSVNSALTVHRVMQVHYAVREEARLFAFDWVGQVNQALRGTATAFLYEEMWGQQDRLHILVHLASMDAYRRMLGLAEEDPQHREFLTRQRVPDFKGGGTWERLIVEGTVRDTLLAPRHRPA
jgi:hypothetical protein